MSAIIDGTNGVTAATLVPSGSSAPTNGIYLPTTNAVAIATNSTNALYIDGSQNVGIGTSSPIEKFEVSAATRTYLVVTGQSYNANQEQGLHIRAYTDATHNSDWYIFQNPVGTSGGLAFTNYINNGSGAVGGERMRIDSSGNLLVGTTNGNVGYGGGSGINAHKNGQLSLGTSGGIDAFFLQKDNTGGTYLIFYYGSLSSTPSGVGSISTNGTSTFFNTSSDYRLKTNVTPLTTAQSGPIIDALKPSQFTWTTDNTPDVGFIAHEMQAVIPRAVTGEKDAVDAEGKPIYQQVAVSSPEIIAYLVAEIQSLRARLKAANIA